MGLFGIKLAKRTVSRETGLLGDFMPKTAFFFPTSFSKTLVFGLVSKSFSETVIQKV